MAHSQHLFSFKLGEGNIRVNIRLLPRDWGSIQSIHIGRKVIQDQFPISEYIDGCESQKWELNFRFFEELGRRNTLWPSINLDRFPIFGRGGMVRNPERGFGFRCSGGAPVEFSLPKCIRGREGGGGGGLGEWEREINRERGRERERERERENRNKIWKVRKDQGIRF